MFIKPRMPSTPCRNIKGTQPQRAGSAPKALKPKASPKVKAKAKAKVPKVTKPRKGTKAKARKAKVSPKTEAEGEDES